jgi:hypothetical protein
MKKVLAIGILAVTALAFSQQQASAWVNTRFGVGLNWEYQSGGNNFLWGAYRNGQPPGPETFGGGHQQPFPQFGGQPAPAPFAYDVPAFDPAYSQSTFAQPAYAQPMPMQQQYGQPFQFATYPRPVYYYYGR